MIGLYIMTQTKFVKVPPWPKKTLGQSISFVDKLGFNAINFSLADFRPVKDGFSIHENPITFFNHFELRSTPGCYLQIKAFKNFGQEVDISSSLGHNILFKDRKVYPIKFLIKHYPLRSTSSAQKKIFYDRKPRYLEILRKKGAHTQYDNFTLNQSFIYSPTTLKPYNNHDFAYEHYLVEFLTSVGIKEYV